MGEGVAVKAHIAAVAGAVPALRAALAGSPVRNG
jgi:hypothetical protein